MSVGFAPTDPLEELRRAYRAVKKLRQSLTNARKSFQRRRLKELDTDLANAWQISTEVEQRLKGAGEQLKNGDI